MPHSIILSNHSVPQTSVRMRSVFRTTEAPGDVKRLKNVTYFATHYSIFPTLAHFSPKIINKIFCTTIKFQYLCKSIKL